MGKILLTNDVLVDKTAFQKARVDVMTILKKEGYEAVLFPSFRSIKAISAFWKRLSGTVKKGDHIAVEFPCFQKRRLYLVKLFTLLRKVPFYVIIHDITSLRQQISPAKEIAALKLFDGAVSHNYSMTRWLRENGYTKKIVDLCAFDYLTEENLPYAIAEGTKPFQLMYAGNLSFAKAEYIYHPGFAGYKNFKLNVYGQYLEEDKFKGSGVVYKGTFNPGTPVLDTVYQYGLIWEGTSIDTCAGEFGDYIRYNNSHKFSLYLALGLPVIAWKQAAIAKFILEHQIGFVVDSIGQLNDMLEHGEHDQYQGYVKNVKALSSKIRNGYFMKTAMDQLANP